MDREPTRLASIISVSSDERTCSFGFDMTNVPHLPCHSLIELDGLNTGKERICRPVYLLQGRAPLWLYAGCACLCCTADSVVAVYDPRFDAFVVCDAPVPAQLGTLVNKAGRSVPHTGARERKRPSFHAQQERDQLFLGFQDESTELCSDDLQALDAELATWVDRENRIQLILWSGPLPMWFAVALARRAAHRFPKASVGISYPRCPGFIIVRTPSDRRYLLGMPVATSGPSARPPEVYAIVGDPHSGKSVLSWKLLYALRNRELATYRLDADVSAPTGEWTVSNPHSARLREAQKRPWNDHRDVPALCDALAATLESSVAFILVDMPGGNHQVDPPERIPVLREKLFQMIDRYIIVQRSDEVEHAWRNDLRRVNPVARCDHVVLSRRLHTKTGVLENRYHPDPLERDDIGNRDPQDPEILRLTDDIARRHKEHE